MHRHVLAFSQDTHYTKQLNDQENRKEANERKNNWETVAEFIQ